MESKGKNLAVFAAISAAFLLGRFTPAPDSATVSRVSGYYIFTDSKPQTDYDFVATIKSNKYQQGTLPNSFCDLTYEQLKSNLIEIATKKYKGKGNAIIITSDNTGDLITLK